ncbi:MAG: DUF1501 domain-containing protein [Desulfobacterales bacterium]|jgi:hypothetical protein
MMNRRRFLKAAGMCSLSLALPPFIWKQNAFAALPDNLNYVAPAMIPQIIHVFLYGGPSELAGNLTNIAEIDANSQNPYPASLDPNNANNDITRNNFWGSAGGDIMEALLANGEMSLYRTINRIKDDSKAHGRSISQNLVGNLNLANAGIATTLAAILDKFNPFGKAVDELLLPFVTFEGDSRIFSRGDLDIPLALRPLALDANFNNPYSRAENNFLDINNDNTNDQKLEELAQARSNLFPQFEKVNDAFIKRAELADFIDSSFNSEKIIEDLPVDPDTGQRIQYPPGNFGTRLLAAVSLAIKNPETVFISLGSGGLGGWDDHSDSLSRYPNRFQRLMEALQAASRHLALMDANNIVINVFGDFGRNVNVNDSNGWDHGNNQNLYTIGGADIAGRALGKLVGKTQRIGTPFQNRQFTSPTSDSYQCEPFAIASSFYKYFGVQNPELLTGEPAIDESNNVANELVQA